MGDVEFGKVAGLLAEFRGAGLKHVDFFGTQLPTRNRSATARRSRR